jgi:hypothetical protein
MASGAFLLSRAGPLPLRLAQRQCVWPFAAADAILDGEVIARDRRIGVIIR